jgi:chitin synthase
VRSCDVADGRRVEGEIVSKAGHDDKTAVFDGTTIPLRRWDDWERSRLRKLRREEKRRRDFERQFGAGFHGDNNGMLAPGGGRGGWTRSEYESDAGSVFSSEDDVWGADIGGVSRASTPHHIVDLGRGAGLRKD